MMKLLKYDWKRNSTTLLGAFAILLIIQMAITVTGSIREWKLGIMFGLSMLVYGSMSVLPLVVACRTFDFNIQAYHRRLLPVRSVWNVVSSLILACASLLALCVLMALHLWYYWDSASIPWETLHFSDFPVLYYIGLALHMVWKFIYLMITIFFAITMARSITKKGSVWIGILVFFVLQYILGWLSNLLFGEGAAWIGPMTTISFENEVNFTVSGGQYTFAWGAFAFDVIMTALILYATVYLIDRKVEV
ncbi:hypothetical protein [Paenibacillus sp. JZ16]|uniref:hypothetical protein n=1 Tax=Paenibacillus sp. JZ16 TaxID=1906272 RepID=UPI00188D61A1|nr:hypothetical protein [Paenibacillus sp. JZ16]